MATETKTELICTCQEDELKNVSTTLPFQIGTDNNFKRKIAWFNVVLFLLLHLLAIYGTFLVLYCKFATFVWSYVLFISFGAGVVVGAHRFYSHRSFKATPVTRAIFLLLQVGAGQNSMHTWVRDHRQHHKYTDTDADPHNANRGLFFSHIGWLMSKKHPLVIEKGKGIDMSDLEADPLVMFQKKYYIPLYFIVSIAIPILVPYYFWGESLWNSVFLSYFCRYVYSANATWTVNSIAHFYGTKPYDSTIRAAESEIVHLMSGEGWHNYHHAFPWDYRASEFGEKYGFATYIIDFLGYFGMVYDLKVASYNIVRNTSLKKGDGSHRHFNESSKKER